MAKHIQSGPHVSKGCYTRSHVLFENTTLAKKETFFSQLLQISHTRSSFSNRGYPSTMKLCYFYLRGGCNVLHLGLFTDMTTSSKESQNKWYRSCSAFKQPWRATAMMQSVIKELHIYSFMADMCKMARRSLHRENGRQWSTSVWEEGQNWKKYWSAEPHEKFQAMSLSFLRGRDQHWQLHWCWTCLICLE